MTKHPISFPAAAMDVPDEDMATVGEAAHAVIHAAKAAGVHVFAGGIDTDVAPLMVDANGTSTNGTYPTRESDGGFRVLEIPSRDAAIHRSAKIAEALPLLAELLAFQFDAECGPALSRPHATGEVFSHPRASYPRVSDRQRASVYAIIEPSLRARMRSSAEPDR